MKLASQIAYEAAEYMAKHGHCKGTLSNAQGEVCLIGAMLAVSEMNSNMTISAQTVRELACGERMISEWNNAPERTKEEVVLALKQAGAKLEAEGK